MGADLPKNPGVRIVRLKDTVHDAPVDVGADTVKGNAQGSANRTGGAITPHQELGPDRLLAACAAVAHRHAHWMGASARRLVHLEVQDSRAALHERLVPGQISDEDAFNLALGDDVQAAVPRVGLMRGAKHELLAVLVYGRPFNQGPLVVNLLCEAPLRDGLQEPGLDAISTPCCQGPVGLVCDAMGMISPWLHIINALGYQNPTFLIELSDQSLIFYTIGRAYR